MSKEIITINDIHSDKLKDRVSAISPYTPLKGRVEIFEKQKDGQLTKLREKHNLEIFDSELKVKYDHYMNQQKTATSNKTTNS